MRHPSVQAQPTDLQGRVHLVYLDGVRAVAALYVSLFHATITTVWGTPQVPFAAGLSAAMFQAIRVLLYGHFAVGIFIVLSGYCLMLPVANQPGYRLRGGTAGFLWRRTRRLLPPYYAALAVSLLLCLVPGMNHPSGARWDEVLPAWTAGSIFSHLLLVQNWSPAWYLKINSPAWSVAVEWQIYWLFPFLLLPLARRLGVASAACLALLAGLAFHRYYYGGAYDYVYLSYVGMFALGMLGAVINFSQAGWARFTRQTLPWGVFTALSWLIVLGVAYEIGPFVITPQAWFVDPLFGVAALCLLVYCTRALTAPSAAPPWILRALQWKWLVWIGTFSYSYYLLHDPIQALFHFALRPLALSQTVTLYVMLGLGIPLSLAGAWLFHLVFERPFLSGSLIQAQPVAAGGDPALSLRLDDETPATAP